MSQALSFDSQKPAIETLLRFQSSFEEAELAYTKAAAEFRLKINTRAKLLEAFARLGGTLDDVEPKKLREEWQRVINGRMRNG